MKPKLPASIASPQDLKAAILEIHQYASWFAHTSVKKNLSVAADKEPAPMSPPALEILKQSLGKEPPSQESLDKIVEDLEAFAEAAPTMAITLAGMPTAGLKKTLVAWCRQNIDGNMLVNFDFNSGLLGGLVLRYDSHVYDWSFRRQILASRERFPEVLRHV
jgi:hypothetical protein